MKVSLKTFEDSLFAICNMIEQDDEKKSNFVPVYVMESRDVRIEASRLIVQYNINLTLSQAEECTKNVLGRLIQARKYDHHE